ncbi:MAG: 3-dehydroquinate synthase [SAR86 cluster bacterium]|uniref:3-dehydroquinate synthase n=1 Tax=SAR86 cluster bacterium TaxID=2030880 RepID=A0A937IFV8_9GAMM|nr:3-dehydroquinate synthase [SAR86 cluster bacterium]
MNQIEIKSSKKTTNLSFVDNIDAVLSLISQSNQIIFVDKTLKTSTKALSDFLDERIEDVFLVDRAEENKNLSKAEEAYKFLTEKNINRDHEIVAIGGGALTDFAGFIAATFKRGIRLTLIPTSLLAQVDASIGGKTAINFGNVKNLVGSFYVPNNVVICSSFLKTLDQQEYLNGLAEVIKHAFITSDEEVDFIFNNIDKINQRDEALLNEIIKKSVKIKADIVINDFEEKGRRKFLNFGHTFGHGIESSNLVCPIFHGHAVIIGIMMAIKYSMHKKLLSEKKGLKAMDLISSFDFDFSEIKLNTNEIFQFMKSDKKNYNSLINLVLLKGFGEPMLYEENNPSELQNFIGDFVEEFRS